MFSKRPIRQKLFAGIALLVLVVEVSILSSSGLVATYAYRNLVNSLQWRVSELPLAAELSRHVGELRITVGELHGLQVNTFPDANRTLVPVSMWVVRDQFASQLDEVDQAIERYRQQLASERRADSRISNHQAEEATLRTIERQLARIRQANRERDWC